MSAKGRFHDLDEGEAISQAVIRENGDEIAFDMRHSDGYLYSVLLKRNNGHIFTGKAVSQPGGEIAEVTCRVYVDREAGITLISGSKWVQAGESTNYRWLAELQDDQP
ncbi:hypothetical protein IFT48_02545 [Pseudomonas fluorescens]|uniref:hypothetical protein n=1 Tax=Pseudomonas fluorescens TaxID=294 RepID=UPI0019309283|nr:hypothetical protein [Pseudomonas fluorescens]MBD8088844.1 hypothetical protein [Pseudomonas fluorescens]